MHTPLRHTSSPMQTEAATCSILVAFATFTCYARRPADSQVQPSGEELSYPRGCISRRQWMTFSGGAAEAQVTRTLPTSETHHLGPTFVRNLVSIGPQQPALPSTRHARRAFRRQRLQASLQTAAVWMAGVCLAHWLPAAREPFSSAAA